MKSKKDNVRPINPDVMRGARAQHHCPRCKFNYDKFMSTKQELLRARSIIDSLTTSVQNLLKLDKTSSSLFRKMIRKLIADPMAFMHKPKTVEVIKEVEKKEVIYVLNESEVGVLTWKEFKERCLFRYIQAMLTRYSNADDFCEATGVSKPFYYKARRQYKERTK